MAVLLDSGTEDADASETPEILKCQSATRSRPESKFDSAVVALAALPDGQLSHRLSNGSIWISGPELSTREIARGVSRGYGALISSHHNCLAFSDNTAVQIWDPTRDKVTRIEVCSEEVVALAALQDGRIASGSCDNLKVGTIIASSAIGMAILAGLKLPT